MSSQSASYSAKYKHYPRSYKAPKCVSHSFVDKIDGDISKPEWSSAPWTEEFDDIRGPKDAPPKSRPPLSCRTRVKMMWDEKYLYIAALLESYNRTVVTSYRQRNSPIYQQDSDFEVFVDPAGCCHNYKELELNGFNTVWNLLLDKPYNDGGSEHSGRVTNNTKDPLYWEVKKQRTATKLLWGNWNDPQGAVWSVEIALAHSDSLSKYPPSLRSKFTPREGLQWRINFSRVEEKGEINWTWSPQIVWDPSATRFEGMVNMHLPDAWGYVQFSQSGEGRANDDVTFPTRLAATNVYYAQAYYKQSNKVYAPGMSQLLSYVDKETMANYQVKILSNDDSSQYRAAIRGGRGGASASITYDRLLLSESNADSFSSS